MDFGPDYSAFSGESLDGGFFRLYLIHSREYPTISAEVGHLVDTLSSENDLLWPYQLWPRMKFDKPLGVSANGRHGPIRYFVEEYVPGKRVVFRFTGPDGFDGYHGYDVFELEKDKTELRQTLKMNTHGMAQLSWPLIFRPLHDALIKDSLCLVELRLNHTLSVNSTDTVQTIIAEAQSREKQYIERSQNLVFFQFAILPREQAKAIAAELRKRGYVVPGEDREKAATNLREVRYFYDQDKQAAGQLAGQVSSALTDLGYESVIINEKSMVTYKGTKPRRGVLELWLDLMPL